MGGIFGKSKKPPPSPPSKVTEHDKAVLELKKQRDQMKQYQKNILISLAKERELAKKLLLDGKKDRAKLLLKKKRFQESLLERSEKQLDNIEVMIGDMESAQMELQVIEGLKTGNEALKKMHDMMSIDEIEKILDETREGIEKQNEIDALLSNNLSPEDLEEVETELEKIMAEENVQIQGQISPDSEVVSLPDVPETPLPEFQEKEAALRKAEKVLVAAS